MTNIHSNTLNISAQTNLEVNYEVAIVMGRGGIHRNSNIHTQSYIHSLPDLREFGKLVLSYCRIRRQRHLSEKAIG